MNEEKVKELVAALLELELRTHCLKGYYSDRYVTFKVDLTQIDTDTHAAVSILPALLHQYRGDFCEADAGDDNK